METGQQISGNQLAMCGGEEFRLYLDEQTIRKRVRELAAQISSDYQDQVPVLIGVLNGAFIFLSDLIRYMTIDCEVDFLKLSSYGAEKISSGVVRELKKIDANLADRHVLIVEDIVDTGLSMAYLTDRISEHSPASIRTITLLHKHEATRTEVDLDYIGFKIENLFVIGYGLDFGQLGRNLSDIYILNDKQSK